MDGEDDVTASAMIDDPMSNGGASASPATAAMGEPMDVEAYAAMYSGRTKILRLMFIADKCDNESMKLEALRMAYEEIKKGEDTNLHRDVVSKIRGTPLAPKYGVDNAWIESVEKRASLKKDKLENELNGYRTNLIKESIRMGYNDMGEFYYAHGMLSESFKSYIRTRDYCTTSKHIVQMCMNVILASIELGQFSHVTNYVSKAEATPDTLPLVTQAKLKCASGLAFLETKKYKLAARKFIETGYELGSNYSEVVAPQDVGLYGGLCALASFDRTELKTKVIDNVGFRNFLELVPEVRELINDFYASRYASCLGYLEKLKANLLLDIHLHEHVEELYTEIRHKAIIQYTLPFISVDLGTMADAFKTSVGGLEKELEALITNGQIQARIDSHNKILYARHADQRKATFQRVLQTGGDFEREVKSMLLRANLVKHEVSAKSGRKF